MARLLYGGRSSLEIGVGSAVFCCVIATVIALIAGYFGGPSTRRCPAYGCHLGVPRLPAGDLDRHRAAHGTNGLSIGPLHLVATSLWPPTMIISSSTCHTSTGRSAATCSRS